jgi:hypothetical protein
VIIIDAGFPPAPEGGGLQDAFKRFQKERVQNKRFQKFLAVNKNEALQRDEGARNALRARFLQQVRSYMGIPYHKRYHDDPASPHHNAPLYLDCCGLVRQAMMDLKEDFGFQIGRWNQAYQYDTLKKECVAQDKLVPGDLIFIAATFYSPRAKLQKYDMVHVEVYTGGESGESTIGARWYVKNLHFAQRASDCSTLRIVFVPHEKAKGGHSGVRLLPLCLQGCGLPASINLLLLLRDISGVCFIRFSFWILSKLLHFTILNYHRPPMCLVCVCVFCLCPAVPVHLAPSPAIHSQFRGARSRLSMVPKTTTQR